MPLLRALIFGAQPEGVFRLKEPTSVTTAQEILIKLSERLGVCFVRKAIPGLSRCDIEPFQMLVNGQPMGLVGMYVERDGNRFYPRWSEEFLICGDDTIVVSSLA